MPIKLSHLLVALCLFFVPQGFVGAVAAAEDEPSSARTIPNPRPPKCASESSAAPVYTGKRIADPELRYPKDEVRGLGEGWVRLMFTIDPQGVPVDFQIVDAVGSPLYVKFAIEGWAKSRYEPVAGSEPAPLRVGSADVVFRIEGENRAGVHAAFSTTYDRAYSLRQQGRFAEALAVLKDTIKLSLNLYEQATASYALAVTYMRLNDRRRALLHIRHATINDGDLADKGVREAALAMNAELEALDSNPRGALCAYDKLMAKYPSHQPSSQLQSLLEKAREMIASATPVRTEVELIETERPDVPTAWSHRVLRPVFRIDGSQGAVPRLRLVCRNAIVDKAINQSIEVTVDRSAGACVLYVYGDPGARFVLDER